MAKRQVKSVGVVENSGPNTLKSLIEDSIPNATAVDVGVAFITNSGLDHVVSPLKKALTGGRIRILTGLYQSFTEPSALRRLLLIQDQSKGKFQVRLSTDKHFHWKTYFVFKRSSVTV